MTPSDVVAVVLNYRTADKTVECLRSIAAEGIVDVVLVENSADGGRSMSQMAGGVAELRSRSVGVHVINAGCNLGFAAGVNRAFAWISQNTTRPALLLNSDARLGDGTLMALIRALESGADVASPVIDADGHAVSPMLYYQPTLALLSRRRMPGAVSYVAGACLLLSPHWTRADLFDEDFFFYGEDVELGVRLQRSGARCRVVTDHRITHEVAGSSRSGSLFYEYHINRGHWLLASKLATSRIGHAAAWVGRLFVLPLRAIVRCRRFRTLAPARGFLLATVDYILGRPARFVHTSA